MTYHQGIGRTVQTLLGHKDISTTMRYAHLAPEHLKGSVEKLRFSDGHNLDTNIQNKKKGT